MEENKSEVLSSFDRPAVLRFYLAALSLLLNYLLWCIVEKSYFFFFFSGKSWSSRSGFLLHLKDLSMSLTVGVLIAFVTFSFVDLTMKKPWHVSGQVLPVIIAHLHLFFMNAAVALFATLFVNKVIPWERTLSADYGFLIYTITATVCTEIYFSIRYRMDIRQKNNMLQLLRLRQQEVEKIISIERDAKLSKLVDNHFMLNSLASLDILIAKDADSATAFCRALTNCYRYLVLSAKRPLVQVGEELSFLHQYLEMLDYRFPGHFDVSYEVEDSSGEVPSLALQGLVENAIKHNSHSDTIPLRIKINGDRSQITVENAVCPLASPVNSTGVGLDLLRSRYEALGYEIVVDHNEQHFSVTIPIITSASLYENSHN